MPLSTRKKRVRFWTALVTLCLIQARSITAQQAVHSPDQSSSIQRYTQAEALIRSHEWDGGIALLTPLLAANPTNLKLLNLMGLAYTGKGDRSRANQYFTEAVTLRPDFVPTLKNLAINELALGQTMPAKQHLEAALKLTPDDSVANLSLGEILYEQQDYRRAEGHLKQANSLIARSPDARAVLAICELKTNQISEARAHFAQLSPAQLRPATQFAAGAALADANQPEQAIPYLEAASASLANPTGNADTPPPASGNLAYDLALCYINIKRYSDAIAILSKLSVQGTATAEDESLLAEAYEASHQTQPAVYALRRAIALDTSNDQYYLAFASLCIDHQDFASAGKVLAVAIGLHPSSAPLYFERAILNAMQDHYDLAEKDFETSADLAPASNAAYVGLGVTYLETGNAAKAIPILRERLKNHPNDANLCYLLGEALVKTNTGQTASISAEAQRYLQRAVQLDSSLVEPHIALGTIYLQQGRTQDAADQLEKARQLDPSAKSAYAHLAIAYRRLGDQERSKQVLIELKAINDRERGGL